MDSNSLDLAQIEKNKKVLEPYYKNIFDRIFNHQKNKNYFNPMRDYGKDDISPNFGNPF